MTKALLGTLLLALAIVEAPKCFAQSQNSGINTADTHVAFDLTIQGQSNVTFSQPVYDSTTNTTSTNLTLSNGPQHFHVEAGYDANGQLVVNVYNLDAPTDLTTGPGNDFSVIRFAKNQITVFDQDGNALPIVLPYNAPLPQPLQFIGTSASVLDGIIIPNIFAYAQAKGATVQTVSAGAQTTGSTPTPAIAQLTAASHSSGGGSGTWTYQQSGSVWVLTQLSLSASEPNIQDSQTAQLSNLSWFDNSGADGLRAASGTPRPALPSSSTWAPTTPPLFTTTSPTSMLPPGCSASGTGQNIVFQHGIFSSCDTWTKRMYPWLNTKFQFGTVLIPSLPSTDRLADQATNLISVMAGSGQSQFVIIGHSQGGLVARDAAQRRPDLVPAFSRAAGVVTVDTPHVGAIIALTSRIQAAGGLAQLINNLANHAGCTSPFDNPGCFVAFLVAAFSFPIVNWAFDAAIPSSGDLIPGGPYVRALNSNTENFTRVGVESHSNKRWVLMRLGGDLFCNPEDTCGGRSLAQFTQDAYIFWQVELIISLIDGDIESALLIARILRDMNNIDKFWNNLTADGDSTDGLVQGSSQAYIGATARYTINKADSHAGNTKSDKVRTQLENALRLQFQVPLIGCTFSLSPASASFPANSSSGSFTVSSAAGCQWSAVSSDGWITIIGGSTGLTSGTISFTLAPNFSALPRSGNITVSGQSIFSITQAGATSCIFGLSPTSYFAVSDGDAGTVSVVTQPGCVWMATTNTFWLHVSAGSTGTGSGTFSFTVDANNLTRPRTGRITVADQTFTVTQDGAPPPDPGGCLPRKPCPL